jgi:vancomycin resistance protein YoaR
MILQLKVDITVHYKKKKNVNLFYVKKELLELGVKDYKLDSGYIIKVYDLERTICDIIKNKKKLDQELVNKAIRDYFYSNNRNTIKLYEYAKKLNIYEKVRNTFEVCKMIKNKDSLKAKISNLSKETNIPNNYILQKLHV